MASHSAPVGDPNVLLAGLPQRMGIEIAIVAWHGPLCHALRRVLGQPPKEAYLFRNVLSHAIEHGETLARDARDQIVGRDLKPDQFPLAALLLGLPRRLEPIEKTLVWLVLEAHLGRARESVVLALAQVVRGLSKGGTSKLTHTIAECDGVTQLLTKMHRLAGENPDLGQTGHRNFDALWRDELHAFCMALVLQARPADDEGETEDAIDRPSILTEGPLDAVGQDPDEGGFQASLPVEPHQEIRARPMRHALDWSMHMSRRSSPDLLRPAENVLPLEVREYRWARAVRDAELALDKEDQDEAQYALLAVLSLEAGLNAREALRTAFGSRAMAGSPAIDLDAQVLRRPEVLPPNCFIPKAEDERWVPTGGDALFPLSSSCIELLRRLRAIRLRRSPLLSSSLLLNSGAQPDGRPAPIDKGRLRAATSAAHRLVLAIAIADSMGIDAAQRAFGDSFGLSTAPAFYGSYPALDLARVLANANAFVGHGVQGAPWVAAASHALGSRARPLNPPYSQAWEKLKGEPGRRKGRPSGHQLAAEWRLRRDRLLIHFLLATGHRPENSITRMVLHDFLPSHAMAVVDDKQADPQHRTRLVCTGWKFVGELEGYIAEMTRISRNSSDAAARELASSILAGVAPVFALPDEGGFSLPGIRKLLAELAPVWGDVPNVHRHGLCQYLQQRGIDPEYRYFQLGWLCHDHHATSDSAPYSPVSLSGKLASILDEWLDHCGWAGGVLPNAPANLIPLLPLCDWRRKLKEHVQSGQAAQVALRAQLRESARSLETEVWEKISAEAQKVLPDFTPSPPGRKPAFQRINALKEEHGLLIDQIQVDALLSPFSKASISPAHRYVAAQVLRKALLETAKRAGALVYLPTVPIVSRSRLSSPFLKGLGLAVAQVDGLQSALIDYMVGSGKPPAQGTTTELAAIAATSILLHTTCDSMEGAIRILTDAKDLCHAESEPWQLRVPYGYGHILLRGDPAILATKLIQRPDWELALQRLSRNGASGVGTFLAKVAPALMPRACSTTEFIGLLEGTANTAKLVRFNGPERLVLRGTAVPALVSAVRAATVADGITIGAESAPDDELEAPPHQVPASERNPSHRPMRSIRSVMRAFDPDFQGTILGEPAEPEAKRRPQLKRLLEHALARVGLAPTASRLILEYAWHLLTEGGPRSSGGQAIGTITTTYQRLEPILRGIGPDEELVALGQEEMTALCRLSCEASKRKSSKDVLDEFKRFLAYVRIHYRVQEPDWSVLYREYGQPVQGGDPALVGDGEAALVLQQLHDSVIELEGTDLDPAERRFREICLASALIAEAAGIRPRSIHGLTLADAFLGAEADYIHLRSSGRFASVKTSTSVGFIPLEGELWKRYRPWFSNWLCRVRSTIATDDQDAVPLFQIPGEALGVRYEIAKVFRTIGGLMRWGTQHGKGRSYWFRKRRVRARHARVAAAGGSSARDMAKAMRRSGHALMMTPLVSYLGEPAVYASNDLHAHAVASNRGMVALSRFTGREPRRAPRGRSTGSPPHVARLLDLGHSKHQATPLPAPPQAPRHQGDLSWSSTERILRDLALGKDQGWLLARHGIEEVQLDSIAKAAEALAARLKIKLGDSPPDLSPPRRIARAEGCYQRLDANDERLAIVARDWVSVAGPRSIHAGCELSDEHALTTLKGLCNQMDASCEDTEGEYGTRLVKLLDATKQEGRQAYGLWPSLRWVLVVAWISEYRLANRIVLTAMH